MNRSQRARIDLREQAHHRVRVATRWATLGASVLAAAFAVVLAHQAAGAAPHSGGPAPAVTPQGSTGQNPAPALAPPTQAPIWIGGNNGDYYGSSGGS
jgi:hypothetical protein